MELAENKLTGLSSSIGDVDEGKYYKVICQRCFLNVEPRYFCASGVRCQKQFVDQALETCRATFDDFFQIIQKKKNFLNHFHFLKH